MNEIETKRFFANKSNPPMRVSIGGKLSFSSLPKEIQAKIKERLAKKDGVMAKGLRGELPGLKIDGKTVTKDNIHEFEKKSFSKKIVKKKSSFTKEELFAMNKSEQVKLLNKLGVTKIPRLERGRVNKILELI